MTYELIETVITKVWALYGPQLPMIAGFALLFTVMSALEIHTANAKRWWKNPGLATDISYFVIHTAAATYLRLPAMVLIAVLLSGSMSPSQVADLFAHGTGPLAALPTWAQVPIFMLGSDFLLYWIHRIFHRSSLWPYHAIHHSATQLDWTTSFRSHPVNVICQQGFVLVLMMALGIRPEVIAMVAPFDAFMAVWQHSNSRITLGPLKYVIATPVFHRWHHTLPDEGGDMNFAPTFAFWDYLFGTYYLPEGKLPEQFGTDDPTLGEGYVHQLLYPFRNLLPSWLRTTTAEK